MSGTSGKSTIKAFEAGEAMAVANVPVILYSEGIIHLTVAASVDPVIGFIRSTAASGAIVDVALIGPVELMACSGVVTAGYPVSTAATGIVNSAADGDMSVGIALQSGTTGAEVEVVVAYFYNANVSKLIHGGS